MQSSNLLHLFFILYWWYILAIGVYRNRGAGGDEAPPPPNFKSGGAKPPWFALKTMYAITFWLKLFCVNLYTITVRTICDMINETSIGKMMSSEVHNLIRLYLTVPLTSATAERTVSTLRRIKNYLLSTMTQEWLNHVMLLHK